MIPTKLKDDAIIEAVCQVQFSSPEMPEVVVGRLSDFQNGQSYRQQPTPFANIPAPVRRADANLMLQPLLQLVSTNGRLVQIGERVMSAHVVGVKAYPGWDVFRGQLRDVANHLFEKVGTVKIDNISLRYINALVAARHKIRSPHELKVSVEVAGTKFGGPINLNFVDLTNTNYIVTTRVADVSFVQGAIPGGTSVVVDVEVSTPAGFKAGTLGDVMDWIEAAHTLEKKAFFKLLPTEIVNELKEG